MKRHREPQIQRVVREYVPPRHQETIDDQSMQLKNLEAENEQLRRENERLRDMGNALAGNGGIAEKYQIERDELRALIDEAVRSQEEYCAWFDYRFRKAIKNVADDPKADPELVAATSFQLGLSNEWIPKLQRKPIDYSEKIARLLSMASLTGGLMWAWINIVRHDVVDDKVICSLIVHHFRSGQFSYAEQLIAKTLPDDWCTKNMSIQDRGKLADGLIDAWKFMQAKEEARGQGYPGDVTIEKWAGRGAESLKKRLQDLDKIIANAKPEWLNEIDRE